MADTVSAALRELQRGHQPLAFHLGQKGPRITAWQNLRYTAEQIPYAFKGKNIGVILGAVSGGLFDVDLDCDEAAGLADTFLPNTEMVAGRVSRPRTHRFYRTVPALPLEQFRDPRDGKMLVELRSSNDDKGYQTVIPPSVHPEGEAYTWDVDGDPSEVNGPDAVRRVRRLAAASLLARCFPDNRRHEFCLALAGGLLRRGWTADETHEFVYAIAEAGGSDNPGARAEVASYTKSRLDGDLPTTGFNRLSEIIGDSGPFVLGCVTQWLDLDQNAEGDGVTPPLTELGVAERVAREHGGELFYVPERAQWFVWDGRRWVQDPGNRIMQLVIETIRKMSTDAEKDLGKLDPSLVQTLSRPKTEKREKALADNFDPGDVLLGLAATKLLGFARSMETNAKISAVCKLATTLGKLLKHQNELDADPWLFNVANGTIDLRTGQIRAHGREDFITKLSDVAYDPNAQAPRFKKFLEEVLPNPELRDYVQRAHGYSLTGSTQEQCLFLCIGTGANGKSVLDKVRRAYMGEYAKAADASSFMTRRNDGPRNDLAALAGSRVVDVSEIDQGKQFSEALVKKATSGDIITARFLYGEYFDFVPIFKLWMSANYRPTVEGSDEGIWRRLRVIPFDFQIPKEKRDRELDKKLLEELPGVLAWAVAGCLFWQTHGLGEAQVMEDAVSSYRDASDPLSDWLDACCHLDHVSRCAASDLYKSYQVFCLRNSIDPMSSRELGELLPHKGLAAIRYYENGSRIRGWQGMKIKS